jgi:hypothetical protein
VLAALPAAVALRRLPPILSGSSSTFSGVQCGGNTFTLTITIVGTNVTVNRTDSADGNNCVYTGTLSGVMVTGTYSCTIYQPPAPGAWSATIVYADGGAE